ncbi:MAG: glycosyltransferase [Sulfurospirillum sp.]|nr:glycosyltransferase [Sulfurospirillum sp.]
MKKYRCNYCENQFDSFTPYRISSETPNVFSEIVGSNIEQFGCPVCGAHDRERHLKLYFEALKLFEKIPNARILHFAPEHHFTQYIASFKPELHIKADLSPSSPTVISLNIETIPYDDNSFDIVIANHILEHVSNIDAALSEINRVLRPDGVAILQTPYSTVQETTLEDPTINTDALRLQYYGQEDHVRLFGRNIFEYFSRFLENSAHLHVNLFKDVDTSKFGINPQEPLFLFRHKKSEKDVKVPERTRSEQEILSSWTQKTPLVSIACITYNHEHYIAQTIESFLMQETEFPFEIIIGEDCSTDNTRTIVESYRLHYPKLIRVLYPESNGGFQHNLVQTFQNCQGDFIALCEGDDYWTDPKKLQKQVDYLQNNPDCVITYGAVQAFDENGIVYNYVGGATFDLTREQLQNCHPINTLTTCFRNILGKLPPEYFVTGYGDLFLWSLLGHFGTGKYINSILPSRYRIHAGGVHSSQSSQTKHAMLVETYFALYLYYKRIGSLTLSEDCYKNAAMIIHQIHNSVTYENGSELFESSLEKIKKRCTNNYAFNIQEYEALLDRHTLKTFLGNHTSIKAKKVVAYLADPFDTDNYLDLTLNIFSSIGNLKDYCVEPLLQKSNGRYHLKMDLLATLHVVIIYDKAAYFSHLIPQIKACGIPVLFYVHTDVWNVDVKHRAKEALDLLQPHYRACIELCDKVVTSNEYLNQNIGKESDVITPLIDISPWNESNKKPPRLSDKFTVAVYVSMDNLNDISMIAKFIQTIQKKYNDELYFVVYAINTPSNELEALSFTDVKLTKIDNYLQYINFIRSQPIDAVLTPLIANTHNLTISPLNYFIQSLCGIPGLYSNWGLYKEVIQHGVTGFLCNENELDWEAALVTLMRHPDTKEEIAKAAKKQVLENFTTDHILRQIYDLLEHFEAPKSPRIIPDALNISFTRYELLSFLSYPAWCDIKALRPSDIPVWDSLAQSWKSLPEFHFFVQADETNLANLADTVESFVAQLYPQWNLYIIASIASPNPLFDEHNKIHWIQMEGSLYSAINYVCMQLNKGMIGFVVAGDRLQPHALTAYTETFNCSETHLIYSDHDNLDASKNRIYPQFKPDFNLDMFRSKNYISRSFVISAIALKELGGLQLELSDSELFDLILRYCDFFGEHTIAHYSDILHSLIRENKHIDLHLLSSKIALKHHLNRNGLVADVIDEKEESFRILYHHESTPLVSIIIPTKNQVHFLRPCIETFLEKTAYKNYEIIIVDNHSDEASAIEYLASLQKYENIHVIAYNKPFNYSEANNIGAQYAKGEFLLLLNNDTEILHENWLDVLLSYGQRNDIGIVGPRLIYPNQTIQHAGVIVGLSNCADHQFTGSDLYDPGYMSRLQIDQNLSAVTAAVMLIKRSIFDAVSGLDDTHYHVNFSDVDFCLKVVKAGYKILFTPHATLLHHGSVTQKNIDVKKVEEKKKRFLEDKNSLISRWGEMIIHDPAYNVNLDTADSSMSIQTRALAHWNPLLKSPIPKILGMARGKDGGGFYRITSPLDALEASNLAQTHYEYKSYIPIYMMIQQPEIIVYQTPLHDGMIIFLEAIKTIFPNVTLIFEIDDLLTNIPIDNRAFHNQYKDTHKRILKAMKYCDRMVVSTQPLKDAFQKYSEDIRIIPNYLPKAIWGDLHSQRNRSEKLRVGWAGSIFHKGDLALISKLVEKYQDVVEWVFFGMAPEGLEGKIEFHEGVSLDLYPKKLASLDLDLALVPLEDNQFNAAKSNLRLLEFGILGWPVICSDVYPYQEGPVTRVKNRYKDWEKAFLTKISDLETLQKEGDRLKKWVKENYMLEDHVDFIFHQYTQAKDI